MSIDANNLERIQQKFTSVCFYRFPSCSLLHTFIALEEIGLISLRKRRYSLDARIFMQVYRGHKSRISFLEIASFRVPPSSVREF
jgi:hypothetical protein